MPQVLKRRRVVNPGSRVRHKRRNAGHRRMTAKQIKFFGTKRQRAALKARRSNPGGVHKIMRRLRKSLGTSSKVAAYKSSPKLRYKMRSSAARYGAKEHNIGEILTILPGNPGRKRSTKKRSVSSMARRRTKRRVSNVGHRRRRRNYGTVVGRSFSHTRIHRRKRRNPGKVVVYRYRGRRHNPRRHYGRRRNPGMFGGTFGKVLGVIGGAAVTKVAMGYVPMALSGGFVGYLSTAIVAMLQGKLIGKVTRNAALGNDMTIGGFTYLAIKVLNDFVPSLGIGLSGLGGRGMGILTPSNFYVPQVNMPGSMARFVAPAGIPVAAAATGMRGIGSARRVGRVS